MNNPLDVLNELIIDIDLLAKSPNNHERRKYIKKHFTNEALLKYLVEDCGYSANYIALNIFKPIGYVADSGMITSICKQYGILTRTAKEAANLKSVRTQYENTCIEKYGATNALSLNTSAYKKRNQTVKDIHGVSNVFQLSSVIDKSKKTMFEKYGVTSPVHLPSYERNYGKRSKLHIKIENILTKNNVKFKSEVGNKFKSFNTHLNREYSPIVDILIEDKKIVIEINGDMWHANPKKYKDTDMIFKWGGLISAKEIREFDKARTEQIKSFGYEVIVLWGSDIKSNIKQINEILNEKVF